MSSPGSRRASTARSRVAQAGAAPDEVFTFWSDFSMLPTSLMILQ